MTTSRAATSRPPSVRPASAARVIQKRRDKPYKTEQSRIVAKKKKLNLHTSYTTPPEGFQFLSVGTPDLADRCKELSRQRGCTVNLVNAKPVNKFAEDPGKISHHIHRIGYHFRSDVVDDACQELGYVHIGQRFAKESDLAAENANSKMAIAMKKYGLHFKAEVHQETDEQVKAAIKELFPKIPDEDLRLIIKHAWEEGSQRVGTNPMLELPRRVQLATIARIRHSYTDYDRLLKAFEWREARTIVEPECLSKLIEWRGEQDEKDDDELEEIVRETIVIDDDENEPARNGSEADDEHSVPDADQGYASDTSLEISHMPAAVEDLGAESHDERSRRFLDRMQAPPRNVQQRHLDVTQKIGRARQMLRNGYAPASRSVVRVHLPEAPNGNDTIMIDGQLFRRASAPIETRRSSLQPSPTHSIAYTYPQRPPQSRLPDGHSGSTNTADIHPFHERALASIEPHDDLRRMAIASASAQNEGRSSAYRSRPVSPDQEPSGKRRRVEVSTALLNAQPTSPMERIRYRPVQQYTQPNGVVDLTMPSSPQRPDQGSFGHVHPSPRLEYRSTAQAAHGTNVATGIPGTSYHRPPSSHPPVDEPYDPRRPMLPGFDRDQPRVSNVSHREPDPRLGFVDAQVAPIQYVPHTQRPDRYSGAHYARPAGYETQASNLTHGQSQPRVVYVDAPRVVYTPVHGAPAAVQQVPRAAPSTGQSQPPATTSAAPLPPPKYMPIIGVEQPQPQYYYPR